MLRVQNQIKIIQFQTQGVAGTIPKFMMAFLGHRLIIKADSTKLKLTTMPQSGVFCVRNTKNPSSFSYN